MQKVDEFIDQVENLPAAPQVLPEMMELVRQPDVDSERIVRLISVDPSLTANVLKISNSAFYGGAEPSTDVESAVMRLGLNQIYRIVIAAAGVASLSPPQTGYGIDSGELWKHSVTAAVAAQLIAREKGMEEVPVFTGALLHDIGKIILAQALEQDYKQLLDQTEDQQLSLLEAERSLLGVDHAEAGARLMERWNFPEPLSAAVRFHHDPAQAGEHRELAALIYLGNLVAYFMGHGYGGHAFAMRGREEALEILEISPDKLPEFMLLTYDNFQLIESLLLDSTS